MSKPSTLIKKTTAGTVVAKFTLADCVGCVGRYNQSLCEEIEEKCRQRKIVWVKALPLKKGFTQAK